MSRVIESVIQQHQEESAFLWLLRCAGVTSPHYSLSDLTHLDSRVDAHIDGLRISEDEGWKLCEEALGSGDAGEAFAASVIALESGDGHRLEKAVSSAEGEPEVISGVISALGWVASECAQAWLPNLLRSRSSSYRRLGIAGYAINRLDPDGQLVVLLQDDDSWTRSRALRAVGELKRGDLLPEVRKSYAADIAEFRFWAAWSGVLLGDSTALGPLKSFVNFDTTHEYSGRALQLALRAMPQTESHNWLKGLATDESHLRDVLIGCGVSGDPHYIPWLIKHMSVPECARIAGESLSMITGLDLAYDDLDTDWPEGFEAGPTDDPEDENVEMDQDENLPWPNAMKLSDWWNREKGQYRPGTRYLCGRPIDIENCQRVLREGFQRQRVAAALELALLQPDEPLFETRAPGFRQQESLGLKVGMA